MADKLLTLRCACNIGRKYIRFFRSSNFAHDSWKRKLAPTQVAIIVVIIVVFVVVVVVADVVVVVVVVGSGSLLYPRLPSLSLS